MDHLEYFGTRAFYRPVGQMDLDAAIALVAEAIRAARSNGATEMLINTTGLSGFGVPGVFARYNMGMTLATEAGTQLVLAMVSKPELIDPQKIGAVVAQNRNANVDVFASEHDALAWLELRATRVRTRKTPTDGHRK